MIMWKVYRQTDRQTKGGRRPEAFSSGDLKLRWIRTYRFMHLSENDCDTCIVLKFDWNPKPPSSGCLFFYHLCWWTYTRPNLPGSRVAFFTEKFAINQAGVKRCRDICYFFPLRLSSGYKSMKLHQSPLFSLFILSSASRQEAAEPPVFCVLIEIFSE